MIGKLSGLVDELYNDSVVVDVNGVGYLVFLPQKNLYSLTLGSKISLYIHTHVREDSLKLFGFIDKDDLNCFMKLQDVPKIGAKVALLIMGTLSAVELVTAIALDDEDSLLKVPGVGKKVAQRIIAELKNKILIENNNVVAKVSTNLEHSGNLAMLDAISALVNLSYSRDQAQTIVSEVVQENGKDLDFSNLVKLSLQKMSK